MWRMRSGSFSSCWGSEAVGNRQMAIRFDAYPIRDGNSPAPQSQPVLPAEHTQSHKAQRVIFSAQYSAKNSVEGDVGVEYHHKNRLG